MNKTIYQRSKVCSSCDECNNKSELYRILTKNETEILNRDRFEVYFNSGENIIKQGTILTHVTSLVKGFAKLYIEGYDRRNLILSLVKSNSVLGGPGLYTDNRNHYTVTALEDCIVCFVPVENFKEVLKGNSYFAEEFIKNLNEKSILNFKKLISLTQKQMHGKMADALLYLSQSVYEKEEFEIPLNRQDLADMTAMSKDSAIRILKEFERDKIARVNGKLITIMNLPALRELSERG